MTIDTVIFSGFLLANLVIGLFFSRGTKNIKEYAVGDRNFSTISVTLTVTSTCIGAGVFFGALSEAYRQGLYYILPTLAITFELIITGYILVPRMVEFFKTLSVAEAMGEIYGNSVRVITAISGVMLSIGVIAAQFKVAAFAIQAILGISSFYAVIISSTIIIIYSSFGGIKAVTFTDILQFFTFATILPIISLIIWETSNITTVAHIFSTDPIFCFQDVLNINNKRFIESVFLFLFFIFPSCDPTYIQRISMSKGIAQARKSFIIAAILIMFTMLLICWISILLYSQNPNLDPNSLLIYLIENFTSPGLKGLVAIGIMAIIMSTADSYINTASVFITHDIIGIFKSKYNNLLVSRTIALCIGITALMLAFKINRLLELVLLAWSFYMPIVSVPLLLAIFGFRSSTKVVLLGMFAGAVTVISWLNFGSSETNEVIPGVLANLITFIIAHIVCGSPKGLRTQEYENNLLILRRNRIQKYSKISYALKNFSFSIFCKNSLPKNNNTIFFLGFFALISTFSTMYSLPKEIRNHYPLIINYLPHTVLTCSSILLMCPVLAERLQFNINNLFISVIWVIIVPYILVFIPIMLVLICKFAHFELIMFIISLIVLGLVTRWQTSLIMLGAASYLAVTIYKLYSGYQDISLSSLEMGLQFKIIYVLLLIASILIAFFKPKQEEQERAEELNQDLSSKIDDQNNELYRLSELKDEFIRNLQHETNTPLVGVVSIAQTLDEHYDDFNENKRKECVKIISTSSERLKSFVHNLVDLSKLKTLTYSLKIREINLSQLVSNILEKCIKLYIPIENKDDRDFIVNIESDVIFKGDEYYIERAIKNIIVNAIQYCKKGKIEISLYKTQDNTIKFAVKDEGIGIPKEELSSIFGSFTTSSKTRTRAGGRGIGLTIANSVIKLHKGAIIAESDGNSGSIFVVTLPWVQYFYE